MKATPPILLAAAALGMMVACSTTARRSEPVAGTRVIPDAKAERGRIAFMQHCHRCHPGGEGGLAPAINDKPLPRFLMKTQVRVGFGAMPSIPAHQLPAEELDDLIYYLKALRHYDLSIKDT